MNFSIVCPINHEADLIPLTLPSFYKVNPSEVVLCFDNPPHEHALRIAKKIASQHDPTTKFLFVDRNPEYTFHQAWVRRRGFSEAEHDRILTTDIDLLINRNVLKAVDAVGKNNVGLASCTKFHYVKSPADLWRSTAKFMLHRLVYPLWKKRGSYREQISCFTGLYAFWRPFWLDSEDEGIKQLENPKTQIRRGEKPSFGSKVCMGEDTYLRDCMKKKHGVVYLPDIGALTIGQLLQDHSHVQFERGRYCYVQRRSLLGALFTTFFRLQPHYIHGYLYERKKHEENSV
jgi:hypothetical protein